jgi:hypothetical protein
MPLEQILDVVRMLIHGTKNGTIKWEPELGEGDTLRTNLSAGGVRLARVVSFPGIVGAGGPLLLELLDTRGRSIFQFRPENTEDMPLVQELFDLARRQALNLDQAIGALLEEIKSRTQTR